MSTKELILKEIEQIPEPYLGEAFSLIQRLKTKISNAKKVKNIDFSGFEGALAHLKDKYTSVELQHKVKEWR